MVLFSLLFALPGGCAGAVSAAALEGAASGVRLSLSLAGTLCLWSGLVKVMEQAGLPISEKQRSYFLPKK